MGTYMVLVDLFAVLVVDNGKALILFHNSESSTKDILRQLCFMTQDIVLRLHVFTPSAVK